MPASDYPTRLRLALDLCGMDPPALAAAIGVTQQAIKKVFAGTSKSLSAENNSRAAAAMAVDPDWLATGDGEPRTPRVWPFSHELLAACLAAAPAALRQAENAARIALNLDPLPRLDGSPRKRNGTDG